MASLKRGATLAFTAILTVQEPLETADHYVRDSRVIALRKVVVLVSISGLGSGLDTQSIIAQLVQLEQQKIDVVSKRSLDQTDALSSWTTIRSTLATLNTAASTMLTNNDWQALSASSSDESTATVSATSGSMTGSLDFVVGSLARAGVLRSASTVTSLSTRVTTDAAVLVAAGGGKLGFSSLASDDNVALGVHTIVVTQSSAAAHKSGSGPLGASTVIDNSNNALQLEVNGRTFNLTLANGTYDAQQLAGAITSSAATSGAPLNVTIDTTGAIAFDTADEGAAATLRVTGGTALTALNLTTDGAVITGTNGQLTVDGGATQAFGGTSVLGAGQTISIAGGGGTITAALAGGLRVGSLSTTNVSTGDGSLQSVIGAINGAKAGVSAAAIQVGNNAYRLQLGSSTTGASNDPNLAASEFDTNVIGGLTVLSQGTDASITIGSGAGAYSITSATNTISNVLPGVTVTLKKQNLATPVSITVDRNSDALAAKVQALVDAANGVKKQIDTATFYDPATKKANPLVGDSTARRLQSDVYAAMTSLVAGANPKTPGQLGLTTDRTGTYTFDKTVFATAFAADPDGVSKLFGQFGSATSASLGFVGGTDKTAAGTYAVNVTTAATQAVTTSTGLPPLGTTVKVRVGATVAAYTVQSGDVASNIAKGLTNSFAAQNLPLIAAVNGGNIQIATAAYGVRASVDVAWDGVTFATTHGTDVAGTINGVASTGNGQILTAPSTDLILAGMAVKVTGTATGALGSVTYSPGSAARVKRAFSLATDSLNGYITSTESGINSTKTLLDDQVTIMNQRLTDYAARLKTQYAQLETAMSQLKNQGSFLTGQLGTLQ